jgi:hypothetical protein
MDQQRPKGRKRKKPISASNSERSTCLPTLAFACGLGTTHFLIRGVGDVYLIFHAKKKKKRAALPLIKVVDKKPKKKLLVHFYLHKDSFALLVHTITKKKITKRRRYKLSVIRKKSDIRECPCTQ